MRMKTKILNKCVLGFGTLVCTGTLTPVLCSAQNSKDQGENNNRPNILFIAIDDLRPVISLYGDKMAHTPNFERLAKYGVTFTKNYCQMALSGLTRASMMTGLRPDQTGAA